MKIELNEVEGWAESTISAAETDLIGHPAETTMPVFVTIHALSEDFGGTDCIGLDRDDWEEFKGYVEEMFTAAEALPMRPEGFDG